MDFFLAILPITLIWNLKLNLANKLGLGLLLGCGIVTGIISALKTSHLGSLSERSDLTWETYILYIWTAVEITLVVVLGSLPPIRALYSNFTNQGNTTKGSSGYGAGSAHNSSRRTAPGKSSYKNMESEMNYPLVSVSVDGRGPVV